jgi:hypothetical protein
MVWSRIGSQIISRIESPIWGQLDDQLAEWTDSEIWNRIGEETMRRTGREQIRDAGLAMNGTGGIG